EISPPREGAHLTVHITATDVPVDEHLRRAILADQAEIIDVLQAKSTYDSLIEKGLIQSTAQKKERAAKLLALRQALVEAGAKKPDPAPTQPVVDPLLAQLTAQIAALEPEAARPVFDLNCKASFIADVD